MKTKKFLPLLLLLFSVSIFAQTKQKIEPYNVGEKLSYEAKYSKVIQGIAIADLNFTVENAANGKDFLIKSDAVTKGSVLKLASALKLFSKKFVQNYQSTVSGTDLNIKRTVKRDQQGDRLRESEALFDYKAKKVIFIETDPNDAARTPRQIASPIPNDTQDLITAIYTLRRLPLAVGKTFDINVSDSGLVYKIPVRVIAREQQKTIVGKVWCFRVEPELFGANRLIDQKGSMILWITDDAKRLPVRSQINLNIGKFEVKLRKVEDKPVPVAQIKNSNSK